MLTVFLQNKSKHPSLIYMYAFLYMLQICTYAYPEIAKQTKTHNKTTVLFYFEQWSNLYLQNNKKINCIIQQSSYLTVGTQISTYII